MERPAAGELDAMPLERLLFMASLLCLALVLLALTGTLGPGASADDGTATAHAVAAAATAPDCTSGVTTVDATGTNKQTEATRPADYFAPDP